MKLYPLTLKFSGEFSKLEAPFLSYYYRKSLSQLRRFLILGAILYAFFGILDALLMPEKKYTLWFIRFIIIGPVLFGTLAISFSNFFERYMQPIMASVLILAGGAIIAMIAIAPVPIQLLLLCRPDACFNMGLHFRSYIVSLGIVCRLATGYIIRNCGYLDNSNAP